jgi:outer membrane biosynthesis protein TonB
MKLPLRRFQGVSIALVASTILMTSSFAVAREKAARLKNGDGVPTSTMMKAHYDRATGLCTEGSLQLMSKDELVALKSAWNEGVATAVCEEPKKKSTPRRASYPKDANGKLMTGAAHLLLQLERDGSISLAEPVCATGEAFANAALVTVKAISFTPRVCDGVPVRSTMLLPFGYNP